MVSETEAKPGRGVPMIQIAICVFFGGLVLMVALVMFRHASQPKPEQDFYYHPPAGPILPSEAGQSAN